MDSRETCPIVAESDSEAGECGAAPRRKPARVSSRAVGGLALLLLGTVAGLFLALRGRAPGRLGDRAELPREPAGVAKNAILFAATDLAASARGQSQAASLTGLAPAQGGVQVQAAGSVQGQAVPLTGVAPAQAGAGQVPVAVAPGAYPQQQGLVYPQVVQPMAGQIQAAAQQVAIQAQTAAVQQAQTSQAGAQAPAAAAGRIPLYMQGGGTAPFPIAGYNRPVYAGQTPGVASAVAYNSQAGGQAPVAAAAGSAPGTAQQPAAAVMAGAGAQVPVAGGTVATGTVPGSPMLAAASAIAMRGSAGRNSSAAAPRGRVSVPKDCDSVSRLHVSWDPEPAASCSLYAKDGKICAKDCGMCFNPGSRKGYMCKGKESGYNCPSETNKGHDVAFACMDWTFGSTAQRAAEASYNCRSGKDPVYFGVGTYGTRDDSMSGLGMCIMMDVEGMDRKIIAQSINTGGDVAGNQFDLQIGAGGVGAFNTCAGDDGSMYPGPKSVWGLQYGGFGYKANCSNLPRYPRDSAKMKEAGDDLQKLCQYGFDKGARIEGGENPSILSFTRVACPAELVELTQLLRSDEPAEDEEEAMTSSRRLKAEHKCGEGGAGAAWCLTRMMDCRKPSGGFQTNLKKDLVVKGHRLVQPCLADGYTRLDVQCGCHDCYC